VWRLVTSCANAGDSAVSVSHVCAAAVVAAGVDGAALSVVTRVDRRSLVHASDELARVLDDQQFSLGEGPCVEGWSSGGLVLAGDLSDSASVVRWPLFTPAALAAGARAAFGFPLQMGAIRLGTLGLYRARPGMLDSDQLADTLTLCSAAVAMMLTATGNGHNGVPPSWLPGGSGDSRIEIYQATGMVAVQLGVGLEDAFAALRARAFAEGTPLPEVAQQVVDRRLRFQPGEPYQD
jgi:ANTAR domain